MKLSETHWTYEEDMRLFQLERELRNGSITDWEEYAALRRKLADFFKLQDACSARRALDWMRKRDFRRAPNRHQGELPLKGTAL